MCRTVTVYVPGLWTSPTWNTIVGAPYPLTTEYVWTGRVAPLLSATTTVACEKSAPVSPELSDQRPSGSSGPGNQPAVGQLTQGGLGRDELAAPPKTVSAFVVDVMPLPIFSVGGYMIPRRGAPAPVPGAPPAPFSLFAPPPPRAGGNPPPHPRAPAGGPPPR